MRRRMDRPVQVRAQGLEHRPFKGLGGLVRTTPARPASPPPATQAQPETRFVDDEDLFLREMANVEPLGDRQRQRVAKPPPGDSTRRPVDEDAEALAALSDLVAGRTSFDIADTDEYLEGAVIGLDPRLVRRLRQGEFAAQSHIDLHGMTAEEAREAVTHFIQRSHVAGLRCVLIVHGKGRNSKDQIPVLKTRLKTWLAKGQISRLVLAFTSARPCDGGTGAVYALLRRQRASKQTIHVLEGAKR